MFTRIVENTSPTRQRVNESQSVHSLGTALYTHTLTPNRPSCTNGSSVMTGIYTATSLHPGGVNVAFADGHVQFVSHDIDVTIWVEMGSRESSHYRSPF
ncbi:MAG: DUF1559 domain-containing protein [Planctomycetales bacterium]|nr:DUF1559 domain-containing protein [Planctomycetales bacterium]